MFRFVRFVSSATSLIGRRRRRSCRRALATDRSRQRFKPTYYEQRLSDFCRPMTPSSLPAPHGSCRTNIHLPEKPDSSFVFFLVHLQLIHHPRKRAGQQQQPGSVLLLLSPVPRMPRHCHTASFTNGQKGSPMFVGSLLVVVPQKKKPSEKRGEVLGTS